MEDYIHFKDILKKTCTQNLYGFYKLVMKTQVNEKYAKDFPRSFICELWKKTISIWKKVQHQAKDIKKATSTQPSEIIKLFRLTKLRLGGDSGKLQFLYIIKRRTNCHILKPSLLLRNSSKKIQMSTYIRMNEWIYVTI